MTRRIGTTVVGIAGVLMFVMAAVLDGAALGALSGAVRANPAPPVLNLVSRVADGGIEDALRLFRTAGFFYALGGGILVNLFLAMCAGLMVAGREWCRVLLMRYFTVQAVLLGMSAAMVPAARQHPSMGLSEFFAWWVVPMMLNALCAWGLTRPK